MSLAQNSSAIPDGAIAYREFELHLPGGQTLNVAFTLGQEDIRSTACDFARAVGAIAYGLVSVMEVPGESVLPLIWFCNGAEIAIAPADQGKIPTKEIRVIVAKLIYLFFADIAPVSPRIAAFKFQVAHRGIEGTLH